ncbi:Hsp20/alpha crystallin family protein [Mycobacterium sp. 94-17]|uniref:Hsp20/alpha crystallin family protein n=1 Tax=Mycobacterium sp. 94-17 TaxID=2986147 RepID=UPI002D1F7D65|nr:Hsp20/alpha crystallin family protein [Mycobacterium sp. 94-17]MEB4208976.1 Hsp20/alpha crystallin family protein [Mycobacterium sp. 94-17]
MTNVALWSRPAWNTDRWLRDFFGPAAAADWNTPATSDFNPAAEIVRDGDDAIVRVELPGVDVDQDVSVEVDRGRLVIRGERHDRRAQDEGAQGEGAGRTVREIRYGAFRRSFQLPTHVTGDAISASYDAGVLTVRVAGAHAGSQPQRIEITR